MSIENTAPSAPQAPASIAPEVNNVAPSLPQTVDQLAQAVDAKKNPTAPVTPATPAAVKAEIKRIKQLNLKVYGQDVVEDLPFEMEDTPQNREYMTKQLQMSKAAQRAMQEKGSFEKQVETFFQNLKGNPAQVLQQMGIDPVQFAAKQLELEIEKQKLSPEQRKSLEMEEKYKKLEEDSKRKEQEFKQREFENSRKQIHDKLENDMISALDKSELPYTPYVADRIAKYMLLALQDPEGAVKLTPQEVIPLVKEDMMNDIQDTIKRMSPDQLEKYIGKDVFSNIRKKNIEKIKQVTPGTVKAAIKEVGSQQKTSISKPQEGKKILAKTFFGV